MSYTMQQRDSSLHISSEKVSPAFKALKDVCKERSLFDGLKKAHHLEGATRAFGWELEFDDDENVIGIELLKSYYDKEDELLFTTLAPYVKANSFIEMVGEDHDIWRWHFSGKECKSKKPAVSW